MSMGLGRWCWWHWALWCVCGTILRCGALLMIWVDLLGLGDLFSFWGLSKKSVMSTMLSSVSVSKSSKVLVFFFGYGELDLGSESKFLATLASHNVASCLVSLFSSSILKFHKEGGVIDSIGGIFFLLELSQSGSLKYLGLYSCSVGLGALSRAWSSANIVFSWESKLLEVLGEIVSHIWMVSSIGWTFLSTSQCPLPVYGLPFLFWLSKSKAQCLLVSHMRKTHFRSRIGNLVILPLLSKNKN